MDIQEMWDVARKRTEILRMRLRDLATFESTQMPYVFLAASSLHQGDTVMRTGEVLIQRPALVLPQFSAQFEGFDFEQDLQMSDDLVNTFFLVRGVQFPSMMYRHHTASLDLLEQPLPKAAAKVEDRLKRAEDVTTGLVIGDEEAWQFSVLLLVGALMVRSVDGDLRRIMDQWRQRQQRG